MLDALACLQDPHVHVAFKMEHLYILYYMNTYPTITLIHTILFIHIYICNYKYREGGPL